MGLTAQQPRSASGTACAPACEPPSCGFQPTRAIPPRSTGGTTRLAALPSCLPKGGSPRVLYWCAGLAFRITDDWRKHAGCTLPAPANPPATDPAPNCLGAGAGAGCIHGAPGAGGRWPLPQGTGTIHGEAHSLAHHGCSGCQLAAITEGFGGASLRYRSICDSPAFSNK